MIFLYDQDGSHRIWMKNCLIALDVVWIKADGTVMGWGGILAPPGSKTQFILTPSPVFTVKVEQ